MDFVTIHTATFSVAQSGRTVYVAPGLNFCIQCIDIAGSPEADIKYQLDNQNINLTDPILFLDDSLLCFRNITTSYNGVYTCTATNNVGTDEASLDIAVGGKKSDN